MMKGVKKQDEKPAVAAHAAAVALRPERFSDTGGFLAWTPEQHFKYCDFFRDKQLELEQLASEPPVVLPCTDNGDVIFVD